MLMEAEKNNAEIISIYKIDQLLGGKTQWMLLQSY